MKRQAILPSFDDQLRFAIRYAQSEQRFTQLRLSRSARVMPGVITGWIRNHSKTIRLESAERLANAIKTDLKTTLTQHPPDDRRRLLTFGEQLHRAIDESRIEELAGSAGLPVARLERWFRVGGSNLLLRQAFELCQILEIDLLVLTE